MGLDTTHNAWHGSYSSFASWRQSIADILDWGSEETALGGTTYKIPEGRVPEQGPLPDEEVTEDGETYTIRWSRYDNKVWLGHWDKDPDDVIDVLMIHSDCEGVIPHRFCRPLALRLSEFAERQKGWELEATGQFIQGLVAADTAGEDVGFH